MRKLGIVLLLILVAGCEKTADCVKYAGSTAVRDYQGLDFSKILVRSNIAVVVTEGPETNVRVQTGEHLIGDISVSVQNELLVLEDKTTCNWVREYGQTVVYVTTPKLSEIISKTQLSIASNGTLHFPQLTLRAMDSYDALEGTGTGNFYVLVDNDVLSVEGNTVASFVLSGKTKNANFSIYEGSAGVQAQGLDAGKIQFFHRGSNDLYLKANQEIKGDLYNIGNVYAGGNPAVVAVTAHYQGQFFLL